MGNGFFKGGDQPLIDPRDQRTLVFVEGNISSGKSTLIEGLKARGFPVWSEAVDRLTGEYANAEGTNILDLFYQDMTKYAFKLQITSLTTRWRIIKEALDYLHSIDSDDDSEDEKAEETVDDPDPNAPVHSVQEPDEDHQKELTQRQIKSRIAFVERSILTDLYSFASNLYESGHMDLLEWKIYTSLLREHIKDAFPHFGDVNIVFLYLRTEPEQCFQRKISRARKEETTVPLEYLKLLHAKNDQWLIKESPAVARIVVDGSQSIEEVLAQAVENVGSFHLKTRPGTGIEALNQEVADHPLIAKSILEETSSIGSADPEDQ